MNTHSLSLFWWMALILLVVGCIGCDGIGDENSTLTKKAQQMVSIKPPQKLQTKPVPSIAQNVEKRPVRKIYENKQKPTDKLQVEQEHQRHKRGQIEFEQRYRALKAKAQAYRKKRDAMLRAKHYQRLQAKKEREDKYLRTRLLKPGVSR